MNLIRHKLNFLAPDGVSWNWAWQKAKRLFFKKHEKKCAVCSGKKKVQLHHIYPRHLFPKLALDEKNFIPLCNRKGVGCHFLLGHMGSYHDYNENIKDVALYAQENNLRKTG